MATFKYRGLYYLYRRSDNTNVVWMGHCPQVMRTDDLMGQSSTSNDSYIKMHDSYYGDITYKPYKFYWTGDSPNNKQNEWVSMLTDTTGSGLDSDAVLVRTEVNLSSERSSTINVSHSFKTNSAMGTKSKICARQIYVPRKDSMSVCSLVHGTLSQPIPDGYYYVGISLNQTRVLDVAGGSTSDGANIRMYTKNNSDAQIFKFEYDSTVGAYRIINKNSLKYMSAVGTTSGSNVNQQSLNASYSQYWTLTDAGGGRFTIKTYDTNLALDVSGGAISNGTNVQVYTPNGTSAQAWMLIPTSESTILADVGDTITIQLSSESVNYIHNIRYTFGSLSGYVLYRVSGGTYTWTIPTSFYAQMPDTTSGELTLTIETLMPYYYPDDEGNDSTDIYHTFSLGSETRTAVVNVPDAIAPSISSIQLAETNTDVTNYFVQDTSVVSASESGGFVDGLSEISISVSAAPGSRSSIVSYSISMPQISGYDDFTVNESTSAISLTKVSPTIHPANVGSTPNTITVTVTDSRGRTVTSTKSYYAGTYTRPSLTRFNVKRADDQGRLDDEGEYPLIFVETDFGSAGNGVSFSGNWQNIFTISYMPEGDASYTTMICSNPVTGDSTFTVYDANNVEVTLASLQSATELDHRFVSSVDSISKLRTYQFKLVISNPLGSFTLSDYISTSFVLMDWGADGHSMAIGKISDGNGDLEIAMPLVLKHGQISYYVQPRYGICATADSTADKVVSISGYELFEGAEAYVKFTNANTAGAITLNIEDTGAKSVVANDGTSPYSPVIISGQVCHFIYDGTNWIHI